MSPEPPNEAAEWLQAWEARLSGWAADGATDFPSVGASEDQAAQFDRGCAPRPLVLHLGMAGSLAGRAVLEAAGLAPDLVDSLARPNGYPDMAKRRVDLVRGVGVSAAALARMEAMLDGIEAYRRHPWRRQDGNAPVIWSSGSSRLLDYAPRADGRPILVIPSLVNRFWVLDLLPERSLLRWLAATGRRPLLLDWGCPGAAESAFGINDYLGRRLAPALRAASANGPVDLIGYCMGGNFAVAAAQCHAARCHRIALIATPWDFSAGRGASAMLRNLARSVGEERVRSLIRLLGECLGSVPVDFLQAIFALLDPNLAVRKFSAFRELQASSLAARAFVATEDWLNDGLPLARRAGEELLIDWCLENRPNRGLWLVDGEPIRPEGVARPAMVIASRKDRIAPPEGVLPLAERIPGADLLEVDAGHVGMMTGSRALGAMWEPLAAWLAAD